MQYRAEIDGLRAVAVVPVILFHAGIAGFAGGYIGVDIFFVISGYLIASIILQEVAKQRFSLLDFYERRARRILPALAVVVAMTSLAAYLLMPQNYLTQYSQSVVAVMLFAANIYFYLTTNYFATEADEKPLLHTWSLGVEEQFYVFFPLLVMALAPLGRRYLAVSLAILAILSLVCAEYLLAMRQWEANFFLIFSRAWELLMGVFMAMLPLQQRRLPLMLNQLGGVLGLALVGCSVAFFDVHTPFPSLYTLVPVVGTCLIIGCAWPETWTGRLLAQKLMVGTGLISYSLYLWHQPLFAFLRLKWLGEPPLWVFLLAMLAAVGLAILTWKYVEQIFRNRQRYSRNQIFAGSTVMLSGFLALGLAGHITKGFNDRFGAADYSASIQASPKRNACHLSFGAAFDADKTCRYFGENITWAAFGDSHMVEPAYALAKKLEPLNEGILHLSYSACPPALLYQVTVHGCHEWIKNSLDYLVEHPEIHSVLLGFRYSYFLHGDQLDTYPEPPDHNPADQILIDRPLTADAARDLYWHSYNALIEQLIAAGKKVFVLYPIPELPTHIEKAVFPMVAFGSQPMLDIDRTTSADYYLSRNRYILQRLESLPYSDRLIAVKPFDIFCKDHYCPAVRNGQALYFDDDHLSLAGAAMVVEAIGLSAGPAISAWHSPD